MAELKGKEYLKTKLDRKRPRVELRYKYYEQKHKARDFGISTPDDLLNLRYTNGWCTKAVDVLADRLQFAGWRNDNFDLAGIFNLNNPDVLYNSAILSALTSSQPFEEIKWILNEPVKTFSKNVVDQTIKKNVEFQGKSGLSPKIRRTALGDACEWCQAVAGTYSYPNVPEDVYRRHANCDCVVEYLDGGKYQDVWSKKTYSQEEHDAAIQERIARAQEQLEAKQKEKDHIRGSAFFKTQDMDLDEYMLAKMEWNKHQEIKVPYPGGREALVEEFDNNLNEEEKKSAIIHKDVDTYHYTAIHLGHNQYKFIDATPIEGTDAEELKELFGDEYEKYFG